MTLRNAMNPSKNNFPFSEKSLTSPSSATGEGVERSRSSAGLERTRGGTSRAVRVCLLLASIGLLGASAGQESLADRRARLAKMTPAEKEQLERKLNRFRELEPAEQARLRQLDAALASDPDGQELRRVMRRYAEWLNERPVTERSEILGLASSKRLTRVKELRREELEAVRRQLGPGDLDVLREWQEWWAMRQVNDDERRRLEALNAEDRHRELRPVIWRMWWQNLPNDPEKANLLPPQPDDEDWLRKNLSPPGVALLEQAGSHLKKHELLQTWQRQLWAPAGSFGGRVDIPVGKEELKGFFDRDLTDKERAVLLSLPADEMQQRLKAMYHYRKAIPQKGAPSGKGRGRKQPKSPTAAFDWWEDPWGDRFGSPDASC